MDRQHVDFKNVLDMFYHWEKVQSNKVFLHQCGTDYPEIFTWAEAGQIARRLAAKLKSLGMEAGARIGIYSQNSAKWVLADLAIMMAGYVSVPIFASMPEDKVRYIADHSELSALLVGENCKLDIEQVRHSFASKCAIFSMARRGDIDWSTPTNQSNPFSGTPNRELSELWSIIYTSGTTGTPKGVMHSFETLAYSASCFKQAVGCNAHSRFFSYLPLAHIAERCLVEHQAIYAGGLIGFNQNLETFVSDLQDIQPTFFFSVPRIWTKLKNSVIEKVGTRVWEQVLNDDNVAQQVGKQSLKSLGLDHVTVAITGSAPIPPDDVAIWQRLGLLLLEGMGQSETMNGTFNLPNKYRIGSIVQPLASTQVKLSDDNEIMLLSKGNMLGYYKDEKKTAQTLVDGWILTGDKGKLDEQGFVYITGRVKDIFKTAKGKYVAPAPIEGAFATYPGIAQCCLVGLGLPQPIILSVFVDSANIDQENLESHLVSVNQSLEEHEKISNIIICKEGWTLENGLLNHTMKMLRDDIENHYKPLIDACTCHNAPMTIYENTYYR